jgi:release factor glutamine methyltransferase
MTRPWKGLAFERGDLNIDKALQKVRLRLEKLSETAAQDAGVLLGYIFGRPRSWVLAHPEAELGADKLKLLEQALEQLENRTPLPYIVGRQEFYGLNFRVTPDTLIPRPETELLVENALAWLQNKQKLDLGVDIGAGSGCIAVTLAYHQPKLKIIACDISGAALQIARKNARNIGVEDQIDFLQCDLLPPVADQFQLICANLPYIPTSVLHSLDVYGREPTLALDGGPQGLDLTARLLRQAQGRILPGGLMLVEIEATQGNAVKALARAAFPSGEVKILPDLAGHDRLLYLVMPEE